MVSLLLEFNACVDAVSDTGMSALCYAAANGHPDILKMLYLRHAKVLQFDITCILVLWLKYTVS